MPQTLKRLWPYVLLIVLGAALYFVMTATLTESVEAVPDVGYHARGGPLTLFGIAAGVLAWVSVVLVERQSGAAGTVAWLLSAPVWGTATVFGFGGAYCLLAGSRPVLAGVAIGSAVVSGVVAAIAVWIRSM